MKKIFILFAFIMAVLAINAQDFTMKVGDYHRYTGTAADTVNGSATDYITWAVLGEGSYYIQVEQTPDEYNGSATAYVVLYGSMNGTNYHTIDSLTTTPGGATEALTADGTVIYSDVSNLYMWRYLRTKLVLSTTGRWNTDYLYVRLIGKND